NLSIPGVPGFTWGTPASGTAGTVAHIIPGIQNLRQSNATSEGYNFASDFNFNVADDPGTYGALLSPLDAATMASFVQNSAYRSSFLYLLLIDKIRVARADGHILREFRSQWIYQADKDFADANWNAYLKLAAEGLVFQAQRGALAGKKTAAQVCFDRRIYELYERQRKYPSWASLVKGDRPAGLIPKASIKKTFTFCDDDASWVPAAGDGASGASNIACAYAMADSNSASQAANCGSSGSKGAQKPKDAASYVLFDKDEQVWIEIYTRSTWGVYQVLGAWTNDVGEATAPRRDLDGEPLFNITKDGGDCFAEVSDQGHYCVPNGKDSRR